MRLPDLIEIQGCQQVLRRALPPQDEPRAQERRAVGLCAVVSPLPFLAGEAGDPCWRIFEHLSVKYDQMFLFAIYCLHFFLS